jgi:hypothetical protein
MTGLLFSKFASNRLVAVANVAFLSSLSSYALFRGLSSFLGCSEFYCPFEKNDGIQLRDGRASDFSVVYL